MDNRFQTLSPRRAARPPKWKRSLMNSSRGRFRLSSHVSLDRPHHAGRDAGDRRGRARCAVRRSRSRRTARRATSWGRAATTAGTFNVSTTVALPAAGAGLPIVKNGTAVYSSPSGAADVLEALGVPVDLTPEEGLEALEGHELRLLSRGTTTRR